MKLVIKTKKGAFSRWQTHKEIDAGPDLIGGRRMKDTPARHALELEKKLNAGYAATEAEILFAKTGQHNATIYRVDVVRESGVRIS
jgi:hypothetical protein